MTAKSIFMLLFMIPLCSLSPAPVTQQVFGAEDAASADIKKEIHDLLEVLESYGAAQQEKSVEQTRKALEKIDARIETLQNRLTEEWADLSEASRTRARDALVELRRKRIEVAEQYGSLKSSSVVAWDHMKKGFSDAYRQLARVWEKAEDEFNSLTE